MKCEVLGLETRHCGSAAKRTSFQDESLHMIRSLLSTSVVLLMLPQPTQANDIVDFFRAISGPSPRAHVAHGHLADHRGPQAIGNRSIDRRAWLTQASHLGASHRHGGLAIDPRAINSRAINSRSIVNSRAVRGRSRATGFGGSGLSFHVSIGNSAPTVPRFVPTQSIGHWPAPPLPAPPLPNSPLLSGAVPGQFDHLPHQLGQIVSCHVPVFTHVQVESACDIAPNAVPTLVAVRDPNLGRFRSCVEQLVYVEVLAPACAPRRVRVSPCRTRVRMDYGRYEVTITSRDGCVTVRYND